jgi:hypothetical protein
MPITTTIASAACASPVVQSMGLMFSRSSRKPGLYWMKLPGLSLPVMPSRMVTISSLTP